MSIDLIRKLSNELERQTVLFFLHLTPVDKREDGNFFIEMTVSSHLTSLVNVLNEILDNLENEKGKHKVESFVTDLLTFVKNHSITGKDFVIMRT